MVFGYSIATSAPDVNSVHQSATSVNLLCSYYTNLLHVSDKIIEKGVAIPAAL
jgi:hypothetical protein